MASNNCLLQLAVVVAIATTGSILILPSSCSSFVFSASSTRLLPPLRNSNINFEDRLADASDEVKDWNMLSNNWLRNSNINFEDWLADAPDEVKHWNKLNNNIAGSIPDYVKGTLVRTGGGIWTSEDEENSHIFDGLAKIHAYRIDGNSVEHQTRFLEGSWWKKYRKHNRQLQPVLGVGPVLDKKTEEPLVGIGRLAKALWNTVTSFDNTNVNIWDFNPKQKQKPKQKGDHIFKAVTALTDAHPRTVIDFKTMKTRSSSTMDPLAKNSKGIELLSTAHPMYSQSSSSSSEVNTYNIGVELGLKIRVNLIQENSTGERIVVGSFVSSDGIPYCHSFGLSEHYAVIVLQPLRLNINPFKLIELGIMRSMNHVDQTRVVIIDLMTRKVVLDQSLDKKIYFYHTISTAEYNNESNGPPTVSLRLCAYSTPDILTGEHQFMRLEQARKGKEWRNKLEKGGKFCDLVCNIQTGSVVVDWKEEIKQGFELPITRYSRSYGGVDDTTATERQQQQQNINEHPRYVYSYGAYANGSPEYDSWGLFKFDLQKNIVSAYYQKDSVYVSEPAFVSNPKGKDEDDGVLLVQAYFGCEQETKLLVLNARTMEVLAEVGTGIRAPMDFHGAFISD